jgi:hypothetical protein
VQLFANTADRVVPLPARVTWRDGADAPIAGLTQTIEIQITGLQEVSPCAAATVAIRDSAVDAALAFAVDFASTEEYETVSLDIGAALNIDTAESGAMSLGCAVSFKLYAKDREGPNGTWKEWPALADDLQAEASFRVLSSVEFDPMTTKMHASLTNRDFEFFKASGRWPTGKLEFKIRTIVVGSDTQGIDGDWTNAPEFALTLTEAAATVGCKDNELILTDVNASGV